MNVMERQALRHLVRAVEHALSRETFEARAELRLAEGILDADEERSHALEQPYEEDIHG